MEPEDVFIPTEVFQELKEKYILKLEVMGMETKEEVMEVLIDLQNMVREVEKAVDRGEIEKEEFESLVENVYEVKDILSEWRR